MNLRQRLAYYVQTARTAFGRLRIRAKLNLLLALPVAAMLVLGLPLFAAQVSEAGAAASTARISDQTSQIGGALPPPPRGGGLTPAPPPRRPPPRGPRPP